MTVLATPPGVRVGQAAPWAGPWRIAALAAALWLPVAGPGLAAQEEPGPGVAGTEPPATVRFRLEEPRPNPFQDEVEVPFVLGEGPEPRWRSSITGRAVGVAEPGRAADPPDRARVSVRIYNLLHQRVAWATVAPGEERSGRQVRDLSYPVPGRYVAVWNGRAGDGYRVPSGPYFVEIVVDGWTAVRKVLLTR